MPKIEKKIIKNKPFFYLNEQIKIDKVFKKIQVYLGKNIPKDLSQFYDNLCQKEIKSRIDNLDKIFHIEKSIGKEEYQKIETLRVKWKYFFLNLSKKEKEKLWRKFAIQFIYESNAIEGSKLSQIEVENIIKKHYVKKSLDRKEIIEVKNAINAFDLIKKDFKLNQKSIINLHKIITENLDINPGYKKVKIVINNKETIPPQKVRKNMSNLISWWKKEIKNKKHPLILAAEFHQCFEYIHPFEDGNGRVGRLLLIWIMNKFSYPPLLFESSNRHSYFEALNQADENRFLKLYWLFFKIFKKTTRELMKS